MARSTAYDEHPQHTIEIVPEAGAVTVTWQGRRVVHSTRALKMLEGRYPAVYYLPREDADLSLLARTTHSTHCPFKGDAAYYSLRSGDDESENAVWTYEDPFDQVASIRAHLAFYADRVTIDVDPA